MNLLKSLAAVSLITFLSRILGFIRDALIARIFGASMESDAFFVAFKIPNLLRRIFAEGAFSQAFVPILAEYKYRNGDSATRIFIADIAGLLTLVLTFFTLAGVLMAPWLIRITAPGFSDTPEKFYLATTLLRIIFPYIFLISLTSMISAVLNMWNIFLVPVFTPTLLNISIIVFTLLESPLFDPPIMSLAWAVIAGGIFQLGYQLPKLKQIGMLIIPKVKLQSASVWRVLRQMGPAVIGVSMSQISLIINTIFTSFLVSGSISWMYYADRLMELPSGVLGVALGSILFPSLSRSVTHGNNDEYSRLLDWALRLCFILSLPSAVALGILSHPLTVVLFQYGNFSVFDALMTQHAVIAYSVGVVGILLVKVLAPGFYSRQNINIPVRMSLITLIITQLMNIIFIGPLKHAGLSLAISLAACLNAGLLYWQLRRKKLFQPQPGWMDFFFRLIISVIIMAGVLVGLLWIMPDWVSGTMFCRLLRLIGVVMIGIIVYLAMLWSLGFRIKNLSH